MLSEIEQRCTLFQDKSPEAEKQDKKYKEIQEILISFIKRVSSEDGNKTPEEIRILPEIIRLYMAE